MEPKDYRHEDLGAVYHDAERFAGEQTEETRGLPESSEYWAAWFAARRACGALLDEAREMGLSGEQVERLRQVAAHVAAD